MRGDDGQQRGMFSYVTLAQRISLDHPLRPIRFLVGGGAQLQGQVRSTRSGSGHKGEVLLRDKVESSPDPDAR